MARALSASPPEGSPRFHWRPSTINTFLAPSLVTIQLPTMGMKWVGSGRGGGQRVAGEFGFVADRRRRLRQLIEIVEHDLFGGGAGHRFAAGERVPDFAVTIAGDFEEPGAGMGGMDDLDFGQDAGEFGEDVAVEVQEARVFGGEEDGDAQGLADAGEGALVGGGKRVAAVLAEVPGGAQARGGGDGEGEDQQGGEGGDGARADGAAFVEPDGGESKSGDADGDGDQHGSQAEFSLFEDAQGGGGGVGRQLL